MEKLILKLKEFGVEAEIIRIFMMNTDINFKCFLHLPNAKYKLSVVGVGATEQEAVFQAACNLPQYLKDRL